MNLYIFVLMCLAAYALLHFYVIRSVEMIWRAKNPFERFSKIGLLASLKAVRTLLQICVITYTLLAVALWVFTHVGMGDTADQYAAWLAKMTSLKGSLKTFQESTLGPIVLVVLTIALFASCYRAHRADLGQAVEDALNVEVIQLRKLKAEGKLDELASSGETVRIKEVQREMVVLTSTPVKARTTLPATEGAIAELEAQLEKARLELDRLELSCRIELGLIKTEPSAVPTEGVWPRLLLIAGSKGVARDVAVVTKVASRASTVLLLVSLVGLSGGLADQSLQHRIDSLWQLILEADVDTARQSWSQARETPVRDEKTNQFSSHVQTQQIDYLAHVVSSASSNFLAWLDASSKAKVFEQRADVIRDTIVSTQHVRPDQARGGPGESSPPSAQRGIRGSEEKRPDFGRSS
ncbi:hypothetical protein [Caballeronia sp. S22]|uniref:hypothetical protein n=1 Tax=Caballeronia sp. S22 TaxID=3137182 RepID=UPI00353156AF